MLSYLCIVINVLNYAWSFLNVFFSFQLFPLIESLWKMSTLYLLFCKLHGWFTIIQYLLYQHTHTHTSTHTHAHTHTHYIYTQQTHTHYTHTYALHIHSTQHTLYFITHSRPIVVTTVGHPLVDCLSCHRGCHRYTGGRYCVQVHS